MSNDMTVGKTRIVLLPYLRRLQIKGPDILEPQEPVECLSLIDGQRRLETIRSGVTTYAGAHLIRVQVNPDTGIYGEPEFLDQAGAVPDIGD